MIVWHTIRGFAVMIFFMAAILLFEIDEELPP